MNKLSSLRKAGNRAARNLTLVPPPKKRRRPRRRFKLSRFTGVLKARFPPELLRYEEDVVLAAVVEMGGRADTTAMLARWPERFREKQLYWTLCRLEQDGRLTVTERHIGRKVRRSTFEPMMHKAWFEKKDARHGRWRVFYTPEGLEEAKRERERAD